MDDWLVRLSLAETTARGKLAPFETSTGPADFSSETWTRSSKAGTRISV